MRFLLSALLLLPALTVAAKPIDEQLREIADSIEVWAAQVPFQHTLQTNVSPQLTRSVEHWSAGKFYRWEQAETRQYKAGDGTLGTMTERTIGITNPRYTATVELHEADKRPADKDLADIPLNSKRIAGLNMDSDGLPQLTHRGVQAIWYIDENHTWPEFLRNQEAYSVRSDRLVDDQLTVEFDVKPSERESPTFIRATFDGQRHWLPVKSTIGYGKAGKEKTDNMTFDDWQPVGSSIMWTTGTYATRAGDYSDAIDVQLAWSQLPSRSPKECYLAYYGLPEPDRQTNYVAWAIGVAGAVVLLVAFVLKWRGA